MEDVGEMFKNEPSPYVWLPLSTLKRDYAALELTDRILCRVRYVFWVAGNGEQTLVYNTTGLAEILNNDRFTVSSVLGALYTKIVEGRLVYRANPYEEDVDLGPITKAGRRRTDNFEHIRRGHLRNKLDATGLDEAEKELVKKGLKHGFWTKGGKF